MRGKLCIFLFLFFIGEVCAGSVGLSPVHYKDFFEPNLEKEYRFHTFNSNSSEGITPYLKGDLAEYANLSTKFIQGKGYFEVKLKLPDYIEKPGNHTIKVGVIEAKDLSTGQVGGISAIEGRIEIIVPYPGVYLESDFFVSDINEGEEAKYEISLNNLGTKDINVKPTISIFENSSSNKIDSIELDELFISSKNQSALSVKIESKNYKPGKYFATLNLEYSEKIDKIQKDFRVGEFLVDITDYSYQFEQDGIKPFVIEVESKWNTRINNLYAEVFITDEGKRVGSFQTASTDLNPWGKKNLTGYFDTLSLVPKRYTASITLFYDNEKVNKLVAIYIISPHKEDIIYYVFMLVLLIALVSIVFLIVKNKRLRYGKGN